MPVLESRLVISAEDKTQAAFDAIEARIKRLSQTVASADKAVGRTGPAVAAGRNAALAARGAGGLGSSIAAAVAGAGGTYLAARAGEAAVRAIASRQHEQTRMQVAGESPEEVQAASVEVAKLATQFPNVRPENSRDEGASTTAFKRFAGGFNQIVTASSSKGLQMISVRWLILDEVSGYLRDVDGRGSPASQARARQGFWRPRERAGDLDAGNGWRVRDQRSL